MNIKAVLIMGSLMMPLLAPLAARAGQPGNEAAAVPAEIAQLVAQQAPGGATRRPVDAHRLAARLYAARANAPVWLGSDPDRAREALDVLRSAHEHGLSDADYSVAVPDGPMDALSAHEGARFDLALSTALLQFLADLHFGRTRPKRTTQVAAPEMQFAQFDPVAHALRALRDDQLTAAVEQAQPRIPLYRRVKATLARYRQLAQVPQAPLPALGTAKLVAGDRYEGASLLHARLTLLGDLDANDAAPPDPVYTPALAAAVRRFQSRHGLEEDGALGPATLAALAVPLGERVRQLELTLERLRWAPVLRPGRIVVVNIPAFRLWAFDTASPEAAEPLEMRVIVGTAAKTPTPLFVGQMRYLEFNPYWNVPSSIEQAEIIPNLVRNPGYLQQHDMELVARSGKVWAPGPGGTVAALRAGTLRIRQRPGPRNVLGAVKFAMPNSMNIYLHSTSARELFKRTRRDLSHGCIRVEHPAELAEFVLADAQQWNLPRVQAAMQPGPTRTVQLKAAIPVVLFYATAVTDRRGRALFADDIYRRDARLIQALQAR